MRAGVRYAWAPAWRGIMRLVLGSLGRIAGLSQLRPRRVIVKAGRRAHHRWQGVSVRHLAHAGLRAWEGKRAMDTEDDLDVSDWFLSAIAAEDETLAVWIDKMALCVTVHECELLLQIILEEADAQELLKDSKSMRLIEYAATIIHDDMECHVTWPTTEVVR